MAVVFEITYVCTSRLVILYFRIPLQLPLDCLSTSCTGISKVVPYRNVLHILMHYSILVSFHPSPLSITPITHRASLPHYCLGGHLLLGALTQCASLLPFPQRSSMLHKHRVRMPYGTVTIVFPLITVGRGGGRSNL